MPDEAERPGGGGIWKKLVGGAGKGKECEMMAGSKKGSWGS